MSTDRKLQYSLALNEALHQMMESDPSVFLIGQGVKSPWYVGNTAQGLLERFGETRVIDSALIRQQTAGLPAPIFYVSGPPGLVQAMQQTLVAAGVDEDDVRSEEFYGY